MKKGKSIGRDPTTTKQKAGRNGVNVEKELKKGHYKKCMYMQLKDKSTRAVIQGENTRKSKKENK